MALIVKRKVLEEFVQAVANDPESALDHVGIKVKPLDLKQMLHLFKFFPYTWYEDVFSSILWVKDVAPREHDATCLALTMRLREGKHSSDVFKCGCVFCHPKPEICPKFARVLFKENSSQEGPVIHQRELATTAWLRTGLGAKEAIPRGHLIATCDSVLRVRTEVRDAVAGRSRIRRFNRVSRKSDRSGQGERTADLIACAAQCVLPLLVVAGTVHGCANANSFLRSFVMKICPFCKEEVQDEAIKCRYCQSMLLPAQSPASSQPDSGKVTYILDQDLVRFAKFTAAALAVLLVVGGYLFGFKLEASLEKIQAVQEKSKTIQVELTKAQGELAVAHDKVEGIQKQFTKAQEELVAASKNVESLSKSIQDRFNKANADLEAASQKAADLSKEVEAAAGRSKTSIVVIEGAEEKARTLLAAPAEAPRPAPMFDQEMAGRLIESKIATAFKQVLSPKQYASLEKAMATPVGLRVAVYDVDHAETLPGKLVRREGQPATDDPAVNAVYDNLGIILEFFRSAFGRDLRLDAGGPITATVHYGVDYNNAFWNGRQIVVGDGDGKMFNKGALGALGILGSELGHLIVQRTAALPYQGESGAINQHFSNVVGVLAEQWRAKQSVENASWLLGDGLLMTGKGCALLSFKAPGTASDIDTQPADMQHFVRTSDDNGGVHLNSGILNHAFYEVSRLMGGYAWEKPGRIWYQSLLKVGSNVTFVEFAKTTYAVSQTLYGASGSEQEAVKKGWKLVGIEVGGN